MIVFNPTNPGTVSTLSQASDGDVAYVQGVGWLEYHHKAWWRGFDVLVSYRDLNWAGLLDRFDFPVGYVNQKPYLKFYGQTFINLLGRKGNFEVDTDEDGVADGWLVAFDGGTTVNALATDSVIGSKAQQVTATATSDGEDVVLSSSDFMNINPSDTLFLSYYAKNGAANTAGNGLTMKVSYLDGDHTDVSSVSFTVDLSGGYERFFVRTTVPATAGILGFNIQFIRTVASSSQVGEFIVDGVSASNLTRMGFLSLPLKTRYEVLRWEDLSDRDLLTLIPYVDSVRSTCWDFLTGTLDVTFTNKGINLAPAAVAEKWSNYAGAPYFLDDIFVTWASNSFVSEKVAVVGLRDLSLSFRARSVGGVEGDAYTVVVREYDINHCLLESQTFTGELTAAWQDYGHSFVCSERTLFLDIVLSSNCLVASPAYMDYMLLKYDTLPSLYSPAKVTQATINDFPFFGYGFDFDTLATYGEFVQYWEKDASVNIYANGSNYAADGLTSDPLSSETRELATDFTGRFIKVIMIDNATGDVFFGEPTAVNDIRTKITSAAPGDDDTPVSYTVWYLLKNLQYESQTSVVSANLEIYPFYNSIVSNTNVISPVELFLQREGW